LVFCNYNSKIQAFVLTNQTNVDEQEYLDDEWEKKAKKQAG
jgi:hypothetical protein